MSQPVPGLELPANLPSAIPRPASGHGLAAAAERDSAGIWQSLLWVEHSVLCLTLMMAPPPDDDGCGQVWAALERHRMRLGDGSAGCLGETRLFLSVYSGPGTRALLPRLVREAFAGPAAVGWARGGASSSVPLSSAVAADSALLAWEAGPSLDDARPLRRLVLTAPASLEERADALVWTSGDGRPTPLTRHLLQAARLRYQLRVFDDGRATRRARDRMDTLVDELVQASAPGAGLIARLSREHDDAATIRARLERLALAAGRIDADLRAALPRMSQGTGPLDDDRRLAAWFTRRLADEIDSLDRAARHTQAILRSSGARSASGPRADCTQQHAGTRQERETGQVVLVMASETIYTAIRARLSGPVGEREERGTLYEVASVAAPAGIWRVALVQAGQGAAAAGLEADRAIGVFAPEVVLFVGLAGGRQGVSLGDVVAASAIYDYETGKAVQDGFLPRIKTYHPTYRMVQRARHLARRGQWARNAGPPGARPPRAFVRPVATGSAIVAHDRSGRARLMEQNTGDALAVDMEGFGFLAGAYANPGVDALVIQGVCNMLGDTGDAGVEHWRTVASGNASAFTIELLQTLPFRAR